MSFLSSWKIDKKKVSQFLCLEVILLLVLFYFFGVTGLMNFIFSAVTGILLLESVNYIEHYGLMRNINKTGKYEKVTPAHSWNSNHLIGRALLFNLSRHSDHHAHANKQYYLLDHHDNSPQMPTESSGSLSTYTGVAPT